MYFKRFFDVNEFYDATYDLLMRHEAQNLIPLGNIIIGKKGEDKSGWRDPANWFMATVSDDAGVRLVAIMTPPHNIALYARENIVDERAVACLIDNFGDIAPPGVMSTNDLALHFTRAYCAAKGLTHEIVKRQRIYELTQICPDIQPIGTIRRANEGDMYFVPFWIEAFYSAADLYGKDTMNIPQDAQIYLDRIKHGQIYILEDDGRPVSIAGINREMETVCGIGSVFTPPYFRQKGYATSCVAQLSQIALDKGFTKCVLYTDLANPTSNSIYQKIGYEAICDSLMIKFL